MNLKEQGMKIEIDYNGAYAVCRVNGKYLYQCDSLTIAQTFSAFRTIEQHFRREGKFLLFTGLVQKTVMIQERLQMRQYFM